MKNTHWLVLDDETLDALRGIVEEWISEGFTTPPYRPEVYDLFDLLGLDPDRRRQYDIRKPSA